MTSHAWYVVSNHQPFDCLFNSWCGPTSKKHQSMNYWGFITGIHRPSHKWPVTQKKPPCDDVIMAQGALHYIPPNLILISYNTKSCDKCNSTPQLLATAKTYGNSTHIHTNKSKGYNKSQDNESGWYKPNVSFICQHVYPSGMYSQLALWQRTQCL